MIYYNSLTRTIDLSNQDLTRIPDEVFQYKKLRKLF